MLSRSLAIFAFILVGCDKPTANETARVPMATAFQGKSAYFVARVDLTKFNIELFWKRPDRSRYSSIDTLRAELTGIGRKPAFIANAGIFDPQYVPVGLHVENGVELVHLNVMDGAGNFFLKPNGVFAIGTDGASIFDSTQYAEHRFVKWATQSGPLLVCKGQIHPAFREASENRKIRSGVGVVSTREVVFAISQTPVTFFNFAMLFRDKLACSNALYLDGEISQFDFEGAPATRSGEFAGLLAVIPRRQ